VDGRARDPTRLEIVTLARSHDQRSTATFDRIAFTLRTIELLRPPGTDVVVYRSTRLHVAHGRDLRRGGAARWALVGVPRDASAESIALALLDLAGAPPRPLVVELTLAAAALAELAS